ncbi:MAG: IS5/IS1182 family transposase, partial [Sphingomonadaceae bacterium]
SDHPAANILIAIQSLRLAAMLADKRLDDNTLRETPRMHGIRPIIPPRANRRAPEHLHDRRYRDRNRTERMFVIPN